MTELDLDALMDDPTTRIVVTCGAGGVGKTTTAPCSTWPRSCAMSERSERINKQSTNPSSAPAAKRGRG